MNVKIKSLMLLAALHSPAVLASAKQLICSGDNIKAVAAEQMGITQPRVSDLVNGRIEKFSIDKLMNYLYRIGYRFKPAFTGNQLTMAVETVNAA